MQNGNESTWCFTETVVLGWSSQRRRRTPPLREERGEDGKLPDLKLTHCFSDSWPKLLIRDSPVPKPRDWIYFLALICTGDRHYSGSPPLGYILKLVVISPTYIISAHFGPIFSFLHTCGQIPSIKERCLNPPGIMRRENRFNNNTSTLPVQMKEIDI